MVQKSKDNSDELKPRGKKRKIFATLSLAVSLLFGKSRLIDFQSPSPNFSDQEIHQSLSDNPDFPLGENNNQQVILAEAGSEGKQITINIPRGGDGHKSGPGARAKADARKAMPNRSGNSKTSKPRSSGNSHYFADGFRAQPNFAARPGQNIRLPNADPYNPGCAAGPRSVRFLGKQNSNSDSSTKLIACDGFEANLTDKRLNHFTSKHGHQFGVNDPLPMNPNQKSTKHKQIRTRTNKKNNAKVCETIQSVLSNPDEIYPNVKIRGIQSRIYHCEETNRMVGIVTEGKLKDQIIKANEISEDQLKILREFNKID